MSLRSFLIISHYTCYSVFNIPYLLLSNQISEEKLLSFLLKSVLRSQILGLVDGPKWTRTTDLTLIRRAL